jgi:hypothetical protein
VVPRSVTVAGDAPKCLARKGWDGIIRPNPITSRNTIRKIARRGDGVDILVIKEFHSNVAISQSLRDSG